MNLRYQVQKYIVRRKKLIKCRQEHFKQVCHSCKEYNRCLIYSRYVEAWIELQKAVKE